MILRRNTADGLFQVEGEDEITDVLPIAEGSVMVTVDDEQFLVDASSGKVYELTPVEDLDLEDDFDFDEDEDEDEDEEEDE